MIDSHDLGILIDSNIPLIVIESHEEGRVLEMISHIAFKLDIDCFSWTITEGLIRWPHLSRLKGKGTANSKFDDYTHEPDKILNRIKYSQGPAIYTLCDFHPYLVNEPRRVRMIKDIAVRHKDIRQTIVFISHEFPIPPEIKHYTAKLEIALPTRDQLVNMVKEESIRWAKKHNGTKIKSDQKTFNQFIHNLQGVTFSEAKRLIHGAINDGAITTSDFPQLNKAKFKLLNMEGILTYEHDLPSFKEVGGLNNLKKWLKKRSIAFHTDKGKSIDSPKGILLLGVQGSGKSLAAKAVAARWNLPLLRLDFGALYNKFFGETEKNLRESLKLAEVMAPCVLWMDELEKGISTGENDQGVSKRLLATLLTWMEERKKPVFIVATANDIQKLPPEMIRKGRMDEIFFVDLPDFKTREKIFSIHMKKRDIDPDEHDLERLADEATGFSGAEIEQCIVSALYTHNGEQESVTTDDLVTEIRNTVPLSVTMEEDIYHLRSWASTRTVSAN